MLVKLNNDEISKAYTLKTLIRYNHRNRIKDESVAEHSFFVSLFCLKIIEQLKLSKDLQRKILIQALLHDVAEVEVSDIPHDVKEKNPLIKNKLMEIEQDYYRNNWNDYLGDLICKDDNEYNLIHNIIELADAYSVKQYCLSEIELGNKSKGINDILKDVDRRIALHIKNINEMEIQND